MRSGVTTDPPRGTPGDELGWSWRNPARGALGEVARVGRLAVDPPDARIADAVRVDQLVVPRPDVTPVLEIARGGVQELEEVRGAKPAIIRQLIVRAAERNRLDLGES